MMPSEESSFEWIETPDAVCVRLPAPPPVPPSMSWTTTILAALSVMLLPFTVYFLWCAFAETPRDGTFWRMFIVVVPAQVCLTCMTIFRLRREARTPTTPPEPSVVTIAGGVLKIERAGPDRGMDYSWEIAEIADLGICAAAPEFLFLRVKAMLDHALAPDEKIRFSIERDSGEVDDVLVSAPGRYWPDALETRLRAHLGLATITDNSAGAASAASRKAGG